MIRVYEENGTYDIDVYANEEEEERNNSIMGLTVDTKRHMYYVVLPEESEKNEYKKFISTFFKMNMLSKMYLSKIAKNPKNISLSGETKAYEKDILNNIFQIQGIIPVTFAEKDLNDDNLEDIKSYNLGMKTENDMPRKR
ncbi:unknown [Clostridium sp. CAG:433]|nr:unknown [Clostridium sp. CAG:433]